MELPHPLRDYWRKYGGVRALIKSPYLLASLAAAALMKPIWSRPEWWDLVTEITPDLLSFSIGGFAIFVGFGGEKFLVMLAGRSPDEKADEPSPYIAFASSFMHFIVVQFIALVVALFAASAWAYEIPSAAPYCLAQMNDLVREPLWYLGFAAFLYSLAVALAAAVAIYRLVRMFDMLRTREAEREYAERNGTP